MCARLLTYRACSHYLATHLRTHTVNGGLAGALIVEDDPETAPAELKDMKDYVVEMQVCARLCGVVGVFCVCERAYVRVCVCVCVCERGRGPRGCAYARRNERARVRVCVSAYVFGGTHAISTHRPTLDVPFLFPRAGHISAPEQVPAVGDLDQQRHEHAPLGLGEPVQHPAQHSNGKATCASARANVLRVSWALVMLIHSLRCALAVLRAHTPTHPHAFPSLVL